MHTHARTRVCVTRVHARLTALFLGLPGWAGTRKVKPIWILLKQETVSRSGIRWAICKSAPRSKQITMPAPNHSVFYRLDALPAAWSVKALKATSPDSVINRRLSHCMQCPLRLSWHMNMQSAHVCGEEVCVKICGLNASTAVAISKMRICGSADVTVTVSIGLKLRLG